MDDPSCVLYTNASARCRVFDKMYTVVLVLAVGQVRVVTIHYRDWLNSILRILHGTVHPSLRDCIKSGVLEQPATVAITPSLNHVEKMGARSTRPGTTVGVRELTVENIIPVEKSLSWVAHRQVI